MFNKGDLFKSKVERRPAFGIVLEDGKALMIIDGGRRVGYITSKGLVPADALSLSDDEVEQLAFPVRFALQVVGISNS